MENSIFNKELVFFVENYTTINPLIYIDRNGNLDFLDDEKPIRFENEFILKLGNSKMKTAIYHLKISRSKINAEHAERIKKQYSTKYPNSTILSPSLWFVNQRLSVRLSKNKIIGKPITILLYDGTTDGLFTFQPGMTGDRIHIVEGDIKNGVDLNSYLIQAEPIDHNAVFSLYSKNYRLKKSHIEGNFITLSEIGKNTSIALNKDIDISSLKITLLDNQIIKIADLLDERKPLLIDVGATWCSGCIAQEPMLKKIFNTNKVTVIGIFGHDTPESVAKYTKQQKIEWPVGLKNENFQNQFNINMYPTYILISPDGKIILMDYNSEKIEASLKN